MPAWTELFNSVALPQVDRRRTFEESSKPWTVEHGLHRLSPELCGTPPRSTLEYRRHALTFTPILTCSTPLVLEVIVSASTECPTLRTGPPSSGPPKLSSASTKVHEDRYRHEGPEVNWTQDPPASTMPAPTNKSPTALDDCSALPQEQSGRSFALPQRRTGSHGLDAGALLPTFGERRR
jgi:hypothetical protein